MDVLFWLLLVSNTVLLLTCLYDLWISCPFSSHSLAIWIWKQIDFLLCFWHTLSWEGLCTLMLSASLASVSYAVQLRLGSETQLCIIPSNQHCYVIREVKAFILVKGCLEFCVMYTTISKLVTVISI